MLKSEFKESRERNRIIIVAVFLCIACFFIFFSHKVLKTGAVFTHLFYIPIVLSSIWWQRKGILIAIFLSILLIISHLFLRFNVETFNDFLRAPMFVLTSILVALLSERMKMREIALQESEARFRAVVENAMTGFSIIQGENVVYQNPEQKNLLGPLPRSPKLTEFESIHPDDVEKVKAFYEKIYSQDFEQLDTDFRFYSKQGDGNETDMRWVNCRVIKIEYEGKDARLVNVIDITKIKEMEHLLGIQDKMTSLGRVAAGIAHEIRNPLSGINVYLSTLEKIYDRADRLDIVKKILNQIQSASNRIESIIRRVMDFSKPSAPQFVNTDINHSLEEAIKLASVTIRKSGVKLVKRLDDNLPICHADGRLIESVILNLLNNAVEVMKNFEGEKIIFIETSTEDNLIILKISDSGPGVPIHLRNHIFDPFYTTKDGSTGIGLSISHRIITDHGGLLRVSESRWGGAEFVIELPIEQQNKE